MLEKSVELAQLGLRLDLQIVRYLINFFQEQLERFLLGLDVGSELSFHPSNRSPNIFEGNFDVAFHLVELVPDLVVQGFQKFQAQAFFQGFRQEIAGTTAMALWVKFLGFEAKHLILQFHTRS